MAPVLSKGTLNTEKQSITQHNIHQKDKYASLAECEIYSVSSDFIPPQNDTI